jgi:hypothetical protein
LSSIVGADRPIPTSWDGYTITEQLLIAERDSEAASVLQNQMSAETEIAVLSGNFSSEAPRYISRAEAVEQAAAAWAEAHPLMGPEEVERVRREQMAANDRARQESALVTAAALAAQGRLQRGW